MSDRGMKKWAPYRSLVEQMPSLEKTKEKKTKIEKPLISNEEAECINEILVNYQGEELFIAYFRNGKLYEENIFIKKIDIYEKKLVLPNRRSIKLSEIVKLAKL